MGERLIEDVPSPNVIESVDVQGHCEPIPGKAGCVRLDITSWDVAASNRQSLSGTDPVPSHRASREAAAGPRQRLS